MALSHTHFVIPEPFKFEQLLDMLRNRFRVRVEPGRKVRRTVYDTFDWLLYQAGASIELQKAGNQSSVVWQAVNGCAAKAVPGLTEVPQFAHDLPPSAFRQELADAINVRALRPQFVINSTLSPACIVNEEDKALVRIVLDEMTCRRPGASRGHTLCKRLTLRKIKGYNEAYDEAVEYIESQALPPAGNNLYKLALLTLGIVPSEYSSSFKVRLDPEMTAAAAARKILLTLLDVIELNREGTIEGGDTEHLHDFRVAVRKSRSALTRIKRVFPVSRVKRFMNGFAWLGQATTPVRDLDVYLLGFDAYINSVPEMHRAGLQPMATFLQQQRELEQKKLVNALKSARYRKLTTDWRTFLTQPSGTGAAPNAERDIFTLADTFIWKLYKKVLKEGKAIKPGSPDEDLHELRKTCKKLRYLMEFFQSLYPAREIRDAIKVLKRFQTLLGDFQDYSVQVDMLNGFCADMDRAGVLTTETSDAVRALTKVLKKRQKAVRKRFADAFELFSAPENQAEFRHLFVDSQTAAISAATDTET